MASEFPGAEQKPHDGDRQITVLVEKRPSGNYFDDQLIPQLKLRLLDHARKILTAGGSLLDGSTEDLLQGFVAGNPHLVSQFSIWRRL